MSSGEKETKIEVKEVAVCAYTNRGLKSNPYLYVAQCNGQSVNLKKQMRKRGYFLDFCPFCKDMIDWRKKQ